MPAGPSGRSFAVVAASGAQEAQQQTQWQAEAMRVLLSDGSGLTARQAATQLAAAGHTVEVLTPDRLALTRFTRYVARAHRIPPYGPDPLAWLDAALDVLASHRFDVLHPVHRLVRVDLAEASAVGGVGSRAAATHTGQVMTLAQVPGIVAGA
jgi:hypothetical protein